MQGYVDQGASGELLTLIDATREIIYVGGDSDAKMNEVRTKAAQPKVAMDAQMDHRPSVSAKQIPSGAVSAHLARFAQPALRVVLVILLALGGMRALYIANESFGSQGWNDYLSVFLWGVGSDVVGKTLATIGGLFKK